MWRGVEAAVKWCSEAVGEFRWPVMRATRSCIMIGPTGMRGGRQRRAMMAGGGSSQKGAVSGGFTFGGVGVPPAADRGQEARGAKWCSWHARKGERVGKRRGGGDRWHPFKGERRK
jgi:hypothetical protein